MRARTSYLGAILGVALFTFSTPMASASSEQDSPDDLAETKALVEMVLNSADPEAVLMSLTEAELSLFAESFANQTSITTKDYRIKRQPTGAELNSAVRSLSATSYTSVAQAASATSCWTYYYYKEWYDLGVHTGDTWMQLDWCAANGKITSWSVPLAGGQGRGAVSFNKVIGSGARNLGWEVRQYKEYKFSIWFLTANPCMQIRGGATGLYSKNLSCNLS